MAVRETINETVYAVVTLPSSSVAHLVAEGAGDTVCGEDGSTAQEAERAFNVYTDCQGCARGVFGDDPLLGQFKLGA